MVTEEPLAPLDVLTDPMLSTEVPAIRFMEVTLPLAS